MPTGANPTAARIRNDGVIHVKGDDGYSANCREANKPNAGIIPGKVITPLVLSGVKEGYNNVS